MWNNFISIVYNHVFTETDNHMKPWHQQEEGEESNGEPGASTSTTASISAVTTLHEEAKWWLQHSAWTEQPIGSLEGAEHSY